MSSGACCGKEVLAILAGGGPAPGINGVIGSAALEAMDNGLRAIGIYDGFKHLVKGDTSQVVELTPEMVSRIHLQGGSILRTSRENPTTDKERMAKVKQALKALNVSYLVTIGGDDTAFSSRKVGQALKGKVKVVHVPKTIDNDLPLKESYPTFGYQTARDVGARLVQNLMEDSKTTSRWYFVVAMGRSAGFLAMGMAKSAGAHLCLIPEEFKDKEKLDTVLDLIEGAMIKRKALGRSDGVAVIAEGVALKLRKQTWKNEPLAAVKYDEHKHMRLAEVDFARILKREIEKRSAEKGQKATIVSIDIGYELRCAPPNAFDREYTRNLGSGAVQYLLGILPNPEMPIKPGCMVAIEDDDIVVLDLQKLKDRKTGKTKVRLVNLDSDQYRVALRYQMRITKKDLACKDFVAKLAEAAGSTPARIKAKFSKLAK